MSGESYGQLEAVGDRWQLRFVRRLPHPPEKVWRAITEPGHLAAWFPASIDGERKVGAKLRFTFPHGEGPTLDGEMVTFDPPSVLEFRWDDDTLRFELERDGEGTVLTMLETFAELGRAVRDAAGWHVCLENLGYDLAGEKPPPDDAERWKPLNAEYTERFGPEAATIGPPDVPEK